MTLQFMLFFSGLLYGAVLEYTIHRFAFHWWDHHRASRKHRMRDPAYARWPPGWDAQGRELLGLSILAVLHAPLVLVAPSLYLGAVFYSLLYLLVHRRSHLDPAWAAQRCPWHVVHHLGKDQDQNYGVVTDLIDRLAGTCTWRRARQPRE